MLAMGGIAEAAFTMHLIITWMGLFILAGLTVKGKRTPNRRGEKRLWVLV